MLTLSRKPGQRLMIGDNVEVEIVRIKRGGQVVLGITAPKTIPVHRLEVWKRIQQEKRAG